MNAMKRPQPLKGIVLGLLRAALASAEREEWDRVADFVARATEAIRRLRGISP